MKTKIKRKYFDVSRKPIRVRIDSVTFIEPFVLARKYKIETKDVLEWNYVPFWLEFKRVGLPNESDIRKQPKIHPLQQLTSYLQLPHINLNYREFTSVKATAHRIPDGNVAYMRFGRGCMWTMIPKDAEGL